MHNFFNKSQSGYSLLEMMIGLFVMSMITYGVSTFYVNMKRDGKFIDSTFEMANELKIFSADIEKNFQKHRSDESILLFDTCPKPTLNYLRLKDDSRPVSCGTSFTTNTYTTTLLDKAPEDAVVADKKELRGSKLVIEQKHEDGSISRIEYRTVCTHPADNTHTFKQNKHDWSKVFASFASIGCLPEMSETPATCGDQYNGDRSFAILKKTWYKNWNDELDWFGDDHTPLPVAIPAFTTKCYPRNFFQYDAATDSCKFREQVDIGITSTSAFGMAFCAWSSDIDSGDLLQMRIFTLIDKDRDLTYGGPLKSYFVRPFQYDASLKRDAEMEFLLPD